MRRTDWGSTALGPVEAWPESLRSTLGLCLDSAFPIAIYWGPRLGLLYNDAWRPILGEKHPWALGRPAEEVWPEIWHDIAPVFERVQRTRVGVFNGDSLLAMHRHGYVEECYFDYTFNPIRHGDAEVGGIFNVVIETTYRVVSERRAEVQRDLAARLAGARGVEAVLDVTAECLGEARFDVPFALIYELEDGAAESARLARAVGVEDDRARDPRTWPLAEAVADGRPQTVRGLEARVGRLPGGAWPEAPREALVLSVTTPGDQRPGLAMVLGASPRRALDDDYVEFFESLGRHVSTALASGKAFDAERERAEALAELDRAKTTFFSNVSHELRTPLTLMLGPLNDVLTGPQLDDADDTRSRLLVAQRNGHRLLKLVNTLLEFSRIEAGRAEARYEETDLGRLTAELAANFRSACDRAGLELSVSCESTDPPAFVDHEMWERIVLNLLSNAFKFTLEGGITVRLRQEESRAVLEVRDTGVGIPESEIPRLFERFHRVEGLGGRSHEGTGIGLALVHELVKLQGGEIDVESEVGEGTVFTVTLPLGDEHLPQDRVSGPRSSLHVTRASPFVEEALSWLGTRMVDHEQVEAPESDGPRARVLVVDDNADMRAYVARLLAVAHDVTTVNDGREALEYARQSMPDLIVSDVMMPRLDGFGLLAALRKDERTRDIPFLMLSARAGEESRVEGLRAGVDDYLVKPFSGRELLARVSAAIRLSAQRREADRRKDEFLAILAHELRNPLAPIRTAVEVLKRSQDGAAGPAARDVIERQVESMARLIEDLMDVSRISRGKFELRMERLDLRAVLEDAVEATTSLLDRAEQTLSVTVPSKAIQVHGDRVRLTQVFINLLNNASKYSRAGAEIELVARPQNGVVAVEVRDEGIGIEPEMLESIWEMFVQADRSPDSGHSGLGIGLTLVRSLVEMHGGTVKAESAGQGRGSTFTVCIPLDSGGSLPEPAASSTAAPAAVSARVLIADDNKDAADTLQTYLEMAGCEVVTAYDGESALELAQGFRPDVALLDLGMPGLGGLELARRIRDEPWGRDVMLVAVTGWGQDRDRKRSADAGFDYHLVKPVAGGSVARLIADRGSWSRA